VYVEEYDQGPESIDKDKLSTLLIGTRSPVEQQRQLPINSKRHDIKKLAGVSSARTGDFFNGDSVRIKGRLASQQ
jgi:hypothetical protein